MIAISRAWIAAVGLFVSNLALAGLPVQVWTTPQGARVWLIEAAAIEMVDVQIDFDAGSRRDPLAQAGLAAALAGMMNAGVRAVGGAAALDENALSEAWADLGASFGASAGADRLSFSLRSLTDGELLGQAAQLAARQLGAPSLPADVWARERERLKASLREARTRPSTQAGRAFAEAVYSGHPYGRETTEASLDAIAVADLQRLHARHLRACAATVALVGAVTRAQAEALVAQLLSQLPTDGCAALPDVEEVKPLGAAVERRIAFDAAQAHVLLGQPGIRRSDPDFFALTVGNYVLGGGGFVSRLATEVREKRGLTYSVYSYFSPGQHAGAFTVGLQTRPDQADQALAVVREVLRRFVHEGPTEAELRAAKDNLVGGFALRIDSNRKLLDNLASMAWHRLPPDYLDTWRARVSALTTTDIRTAFERALNPDRMVTVVLGAKP